MSPKLDVTDVLLDPDFMDSLSYARNAKTVSTGGIASLTPTTVSFKGVVTADRGNDLLRQAEGVMIEGSILVHAYRVQLTAGKAGFDADIVTWRGRSYTVTNVKDYSSYGKGFVCATCEPVDLAGGP